MIISTIWVSTTDSFDDACCLTAWDQWRRDKYPREWSDELKKANDQYLNVRVIDIEASTIAISNCFETPRVAGEVPHDQTSKVIEK